MNSTSSSKEILKISDMSFAYQLKYFEFSSLKEQFIYFFKYPLKNFLRPQVPFPILQNINLSIHKGDRVGILGVNGSGKTTLCRVIAGMLCPHSGEIKLTGACRAIFETNIGILPDLTGRENAHLLTTLLYPGHTKEKRIALAEEALKFSELENFVDIPFSQYSKGMQTRLCLSIISAESCELLILDETFGGVDKFFQEKISKRLFSMIDQSMASIIVSHDFDNIKKICNRVIIFSQNKIVFDGETEEGINRYSQINSDVP